MAPSCCKKGLRIFPEPRPASVYGCHLYLRLSLPRHGSSPRCLCSSLKPWIGSNISLEGDISGVWASGSVVNLLVGTCLGGSLRKSASGVASGVNGEMTREAGLLGVSRPFALESCGEPGHALTGTSRDPGCSGAQYHGKKQELVRKAFVSLKLNNPYSPTEHGPVPGHRHWVGIATGYLV